MFHLARGDKHVLQDLSKALFYRDKGQKSNTTLGLKVFAVIVFVEGPRGQQSLYGGRVYASAHEHMRTSGARLWEQGMEEGKHKWSLGMTSAM